jgi:hypothetical protein
MEQQPLSPVEEGLNWDSLPLSTALATKGTSGFGTNRINKQLYGLPTETSQYLTVPLECLELQKMETSRYGIILLEIYWSNGYLDSSSTNRTVKLMDSGNLVVSDDDDQSATSLWESFKNPTDTVLPGMNISEFLSLTSWKLDGDPGQEQFTFSKIKKRATTLSQNTKTTHQSIIGEVVG